MAAGALGIVECFYGPTWSAGDRGTVLRAAAAMGYDRYLVGLKDDPFHRDRWRDPYPPHRLGEQAALVEAGRGRGVEVGFALSPGLDIAYGEGPELERLVDKFRPWQAMGCRLFGLFFDDIPAGADPVAFAEGQAEAADHLARALDTASGRAQLLFCPTEYWGTAATPYLERLGRLLPEEVRVFWTGPEIVSPAIRAEDAAQVAGALRRRPTLWDNYPVNDAEMTLELHLGPLQGRSAALAAVLDGLYFNPMEWAHASLVPLHTAARYARSPQGYDARQAFEAALAAVIADPALRDAVRILAAAANRSAVSGRGLAGIAPPDAAACGRAAATLLAAACPLGDELRPWARRLAAQAASAADGRPEDRALWPHLLAAD
jgi:hyaluronoglucosaminidase